MKRLSGLTSIVVLIAVLAIGYSNTALFACGFDGLGAGYTKTAAAEKLENVSIKVTGMTCGMCTGKIESELAKLPEVKSSDIDWKTGSVAVQVTPGSDHSALANAVKSAGFEVASAKCECGGG